MTGGQILIPFGNAPALFAADRCGLHGIVDIAIWGTGGREFKSRRSDHLNRGVSYADPQKRLRSIERKSAGAAAPMSA
jgi:hypothetical protein